jgi:barstar (barnase inhibitor)
MTAKEIPPNLVADVTLYSADKGGRSGPVRGDRFGCPAKFHEKDFTGWDCLILLQGKQLAPGEIGRFGIVFASPVVAPVFRWIDKFYLCEGPRAIGEASAVGDMLEIELDASNWMTAVDFYDALLSALGSPPGHGRNINALIDSMIHGGLNKIEPPYAIRIRHLAQAPKKVVEHVELAQQALLGAQRGRILEVLFDIMP